MPALSHAELVAKYSPLAARGDDAIDEHLARESATFAVEYGKHKVRADDLHIPFDPLAALIAAHRAVEAVTDNDASMPLGINHFNAILRHEGREAYDAEVYKLYKRDPAYH